MKTVFGGRTVAVACLLGLVMGGTAVPHVASAQTVITSQTIGLTADGAGTQLTYDAAPEELFLASKKAGDLLTQTLQAYNQHFASQWTTPPDLALTIAVKPNRRLLFVVHPTTVTPDPDDQEGINAQWPGRPAEPPGYPATPDDVTDVVIRRFQNGYRRDTQFHRRPPDASGQPGPWQMVYDNITYVGGGTGGGSGSGGGGSVIVHPPVASEEDPN